MKYTDLRSPEYLARRLDEAEAEVSSLREALKLANEMAEAMEAMHPRAKCLEKGNSSTCRYHESWLRYLAFRNAIGVSEKHPQTSDTASLGSADHKDGA